MTAPTTSRAQENRAALLERLAELAEVRRQANLGGSEQSLARHRARGKLTARERIELLLDRDSPFLEIAPLAGCHEGGVVPGGSIVSGIGWVHGVPCAIAASDAYFPFPDGLQVLADAGVRAIAEPGGSIRDGEVIAAAEAAGVSLYFTGTRHFFH